MSLSLGDRWAKLECVETFWRESPQYGQTVTYEDMIADYKGRQYVYKLRCECGKLIIIRAKCFPGRRLMLDCGCGIGDMLAGGRTSLDVRLPAALINELRAKAQELDLTYSALAVRWMERALNKKWAEDWKPAKRQRNRKKQILVELRMSIPLGILVRVNWFMDRGMTRTAAMKLLIEMGSVEEETISIRGREVEEVQE